MTLGMLIATLKTRPAEHSVQFDFGGLIPRDVDSYRGYYDQLALGYDNNWQKDTTVSDLISRLSVARGKTFTGYKGGEYVMDDHTRIWAANYGECHSTAIVGLSDCDYETILATAFRDN